MRILLSTLAATAACAGSLAAQTSRETLRQAERGLSGTFQGAGFADALVGSMSPDAVLLIEGAPILRGDSAVQAIRTLPSAAGSRLTWMPYRVVIASDQTVGVTFGAVLLEPKAGAATTGRYIALWRRDAGSWKLAAYVQNGAWPTTVTLPDSLTRAPSSSPEPHDPMADADRAFSRLAGDSGAPAAFARFIAPDGITFAGTGEINIGPANVRSRMSEGPAAQAAWKWWPVYTIAAASGELGGTIGEAEIRAAGGEPFYSKYITIWQRQPDGSLKFIVDGGNGRPRAP